MPYYYYYGFVSSLQETISIPAKTVAYAAVVVQNGDSHIYGGVHELRRHPDYRNGAIFIPERQKKKICCDERLHMSIRNRIDKVQVLEQGTVVGQIVVVGSGEPEAEFAAAKKPPAIVATVETVEIEEVPRKKVKSTSPLGERRSETSETGARGEAEEGPKRKKSASPNENRKELAAGEPEECRIKRVKSASPEAKSVAKRSGTAEEAAQKVKTKSVLTDPQLLQKRKAAAAEEEGEVDVMSRKKIKSPLPDSNPSERRTELVEVEEGGVPRKKLKKSPSSEANSAESRTEAEVDEVVLISEVPKRKKSPSPEAKAPVEARGQADKNLILAVLKQAKLNADPSLGTRYRYLFF